MIGVGVQASQAAEAPGRFDDIARALVLDNKARLFPDDPSAVEITSVALGAPRHFRWGCFHRSLEVFYRRNGAGASLKVWLKFGPELDELFPTLLAYDRWLGGRVFPRPYFAGQAPEGGVAFLATAHIEGELLRDRFLRAALTRQTARLEPVLRSNGAKMRAFHDVFPVTEEISVDALVARLTALARATPHFAPAERERVVAQLARCADGLSLGALPAIRTHNDWVLRNIIITPDGEDFVIDNQDLHGRLNWRWSDLALFLLNLENQLKWQPLIGRATMSRLWRAFWQGYLGRAGLPDGLTAAQLPAVLYIVRLDWLLDGIVRHPYLDIAGQGVNRRYRRRLKESVLRGEHTLLDIAGWP